ncbi:MAG: Smr/MutS family protein [Desulfovibrio sp.]|nr:Smr/MutS family protein [Desulfovibrio sp.]
MDDDAGLFLDAVGHVRSLRTKGREVAVKPPLAASPTSAGDIGENDLRKFMEGGLEFALSSTDEYLEGHVVGLEPLIMNKLRAGSFSPEAHLDLHGLNAIQAFESLRGFIRAGWYKGMRTVLVVPGRGRNSPQGMGVLREKLPSWLTQEPFKRVVLAFCTAQSHDGGLGGIYVLLRKYRKKGRICWETMPADADLY